MWDNPRGLECDLMLAVTSQPTSLPVHFHHTNYSRTQGDLRPEIARACDYMRAGPHKGAYRLKPSFATVKSTRPDANDGVV